MQILLEEKILGNLIERYPLLSDLKKNIEDTARAMIECYKNSGKVLVCGNGGSAADAEHIVGELMKGFMLKRPLEGELKEKFQNLQDPIAAVIIEKLQSALPAISLSSHLSLFTAFVNDVDAELVFAQQVLGLGKKGDVLIALSTSGNSKNVLYALYTARVLGLTTIGFTGKDGGKMRELCDVLINVPSSITYEVQEYHLPIYHAVCMLVEKYFFQE